MQAIFNAMIDDALAKWEGERGIRGTKHENTPLWKLSAQNIGKPNDGFRGLGPHPLGWFVLGFGPGSGAWDPTTHSDVYDTTLAYSTNSPWQQNFLIIELGRAVELGYAADKLFAYAGSNIIGQLTTDGYPTRMIGRYQIPDAKKSPSPPGFAYFQTWKEAATAWAPAFRDRPVIDYWPQTGQEFYWDVARGATGMAAALPGGALAWKRFGELIAKQTAQTGQAPNWNLDPTWAIIPRKSIH